MKEIPIRDFDFIVSPAKLLTPEIVQMVSSIHEYKGKQELFLEANVDELKTLLIRKPCSAFEASESF